MVNAKQQPTAAGGGDSFIAIWKCVATCWKEARTRAHTNCSTNVERGETILPFDLFHIANEVWRAALAPFSHPESSECSMECNVGAYCNNTTYSKLFTFISIHKLVAFVKKHVAFLHSLHKFSIRKLWCLILRWLLTGADSNQSFFLFTMNFKLDCRPNSNSRLASNQASSRNNSFPFCGKFKAIVS